ncbi:MAG TPA: thioesterase family protein [Longimicrobiales bacterium]|nr:thioesterase family protein [Longimicrobiales bacterium]
MSRGADGKAGTGPRAGGDPGARPVPGDFGFVQEVDVRFRDLDPMGHAHHSLPLVYWEESRARYWREVAGRDTVAAIDYVMGEFTLRWHRRILYPARLRAGVRVTRLGRSSFDMEYGLWDAEGALLSSGRSTQVLFDYAAGRSRPLDDETRRRIEAHEGRPLSGRPAPGP